MRWLAGRRLHIGTLSPRARALAVAGLVTCGVAGVLIVAVGAKWTFPFGIDPTLRGRSLARVVVLFSFLGLGVASALLTASVRTRAVLIRRATFLAVAALGAGVSAGTILSASYLDAFAGSGPIVARVAGWIGMAAAAALALLPDAVAGRRPWIRPVLAALPFGLSALAYVATTGPALPGAAFGLAADTRVLPRDVVGQTIETVTGGLAVGLAILVLWGAMQSSRLALGLGRGAVDVFRRSSRVVGGVFAVALIAKLAVLGLGTRARSHRPSGARRGTRASTTGRSRGRSRSCSPRRPSPGSLRALGRPLREDDASAPAWSVVVGFTAVFLAATALFLFVLMALLLPSTTPAARLEAWATEPARLRSRALGHRRDRRPRDRRGHRAVPSLGGGRRGCSSSSRSRRGRFRGP